MAAAARQELDFLIDLASIRLEVARQRAIGLTHPNAWSGRRQPGGSIVARRQNDLPARRIFRSDGRRRAGVEHDGGSQAEQRRQRDEHATPI